MRAAAAAMLLALETTAAVAAMPGAAQAQQPAIRAVARTDDHEGTLALVGVRLGWLVTGGEGFIDRPVLQLDGGVQLGRARVGGPPTVALTLGAALGIGEIFGNSLVSTRLLGGLEFPLALEVPYLGASPLELVPAVQAGYQRAFSEDERSGFTLRATLGLRLLPAGRFYFTLEPLSFVLLPSPGPGKDRGSSQLAYEFGLIKIGWRF